jgi:hypothetical protein
VGKETKTAPVKEQKTIQKLQPNKTCKCGACEPPKQKLPDGIRRLKVYNKYINGNCWPAIVLQGKWVEDTGFDIGGSVLVATENGKLTITFEKEEDWHLKVKPCNFLQLQGLDILLRTQVTLRLRLAPRWGLISHTSFIIFIIINKSYIPL